MYIIREASPGDVQPLAALLRAYMVETYDSEWRGSIAGLLQDGFGLVSSFVRLSDPPHSESVLHQLLSGFPADQNGRAISLRAPPVLL